MAVSDEYTPVIVKKCSVINNRGTASLKATASPDPRSDCGHLAATGLNLVKLEAGADKVIDLVGQCDHRGPGPAVNSDLMHSVE